MSILYSLDKMAISADFDRKQDLLVIRVSGVMTMDGWKGFLGELLGHPHWHPGMAQLIYIGPKVLMGDITTDVIEAYAEWELGWNRRYRRRAHTRTAVVCTDPLKLGLIEVWHSVTAADPHVETRVFDGDVEAKDWLTSPGGRRTNAA